MRPRNIFLDDGGVMSDNELRPPQWQRLLGEFMALRLGREPLEWAEANKDTAERVFIQHSAALGSESPFLCSGMTTSTTGCARCASE